MALKLPFKCFNGLFRFIVILFVCNCVCVYSGMVRVCHPYIGSRLHFMRIPKYAVAQVISRSKVAPLSFCSCHCQVYYCIYAGLVTAACITAMIHHEPRICNSIYNETCIKIYYYEDH